MLDNSIVNKTSPEASGNRRTDRKDHILSQADALTKKTKCLSNVMFSPFSDIHIDLNKVTNWLADLSFA